MFPAGRPLGTEARFFIPPWGRAEPDLMEIDFGTELPAGTQISVSMRNEAVSPEDWVTRLYWWEYRDTNDDLDDGQAQPGGRVGKWRTGAGHDPERDAWRDLAYVDSEAFKEYRHDLVAPASKVQLRRREWRTVADGGLQRGAANAYVVEVQAWSAQHVRDVGAGVRQPVRLLDVTWFPGAPLLLALHGAQSTLFRGRTVDEVRDPANQNPFGYVRQTAFTADMVRTMHAHPTPDGVYLHSAAQAEWQPYLLRLDPATQSIVLDTETVIPPAPFERNGVRIDGWAPAYPPAAILPWQGRLLVAGTGVAPNAFWASEAGNRRNFRAPVIGTGPGQAPQLLASHPFMVSETGRPLNRILAMHGGLLLVFFGSHGISIADRPFLSAADFGFRENAERGIKQGVPPIEIGTGRLVFVDRTGQSVWLMTYANERQGYVLSELSQVAPHLLNDPQDLIWYEGLPEGGTAALVVNENGSLACCAIQPEGEWHAWSLWTSGVAADEETGEGGDIEDVEPYAGALWAVTRRGVDTHLLYLEQFDPLVELDFCHVSAEGTHPYHDAYDQWAAVAVLKDGRRKRLGMEIEDEDVRYSRSSYAAELARARPDQDRLAALAEGFEPFDRRRPMSNDVEAGLSGIIGSEAEARTDAAMRERRARLQVDFDASDVAEWQVGIRFPWKVETMPFVKRTSAGNRWQGQSKTMECYVNVEGGMELTDLDEFGDPTSYAPYLVNRRIEEQVHRLFSERDIRALATERYEASHRFVNFVGWHDDNRIAVDGWGDLTITSLSRTVEA